MVGVMASSDRVNIILLEKTYVLQHILFSQISSSPCIVLMTVDTSEYNWLSVDANLMIFAYANGAEAGKKEED